jgi:endonuclease YncB( thermonuclease family)
MPASAEERLTRRKLLTLAGTAASGFALPTGSGRASGGPTSQLLSTQSGGRTEVDVIKISDGDTVDVRFDDGSEDTIRVIGVDTPEKEQFARFERPEEWEGFAYNPNRSTLERLSFSSSCSLFAADGTQLTADDQIAVWAAESAETTDTDGNAPIVEYGAETRIPLVAVDDTVAGFGAVLAEDEGQFEEDHEEFLINIWNKYIGDGTVLWDEGHDQYYTLDRFEQYVDLAKKNNYTIEPTENLTDELGNADGVVITSPRNGFSGRELDALRSFRDDGGALFVHSQSDFENFDETRNLNDLARGLDLSFRFNDDQVVDTYRNEGEAFRPWTERFNEAAYPLFFLDRAGIDGGATTRTTQHLITWANRGTEFGRERLANETIEISFDPNEPRRGSFGRLLAFIWYDATGDGSRDTLYNRELVEQGYARAYSSGISRFHEFRAAEEQARTRQAGVWEQSDLSAAPSYRNRPVETVFAPNPASVRTATGKLSPERAPVLAETSATHEGTEVTYTEHPPIVGVDPEARTAVVGASLIDEQYEQTEGYPVDTSIYENFVVVTNLITALTDREGWILIEGGHGQFGADHGQSEEDAAYYQRYLEGQQIRFEQLNEVSEEFLTGRAVIVTAPVDPYSEAERTALQSFRDAGGAVVLMGSAAAPDSALENLDAIATALGTDLRVGRGNITDTDNARNENASLIETSVLNSDFASLLAPHDGTATLPETAARPQPTATATSEDSASTGDEGTTPGDEDSSSTPTETSIAGESDDSSSLVVGAGIGAVVLALGGWLGLRARNQTDEGDEGDETDTEFDSPEAEEWFGSNDEDDEQR